MASTIPPEIWARTAEFIPSNILQNLYSVNRVFLDLALNDKYNHVNLSFCWMPKTTKRRLMHLRCAHIAQRVQKLTLCANWLMANIALRPIPRRFNLRMTIAVSLPFNLGRFVDSFICRISDLDKANKMMEKLVLNFPNLSSLVILEAGPSFLNQPSPPWTLVNAYTACASKLRTLSIEANLNTLFPQNGSELTSLEEVTFTFSPRGACTADFEAASAFFQSIASTLTTLNISFHESSDDPSALLQSFPREGGKPVFPKLTSFSFFHSRRLGSSLASPTVMHFLNQHAATLKHLRLQHRGSAIYASQSLGEFELVLPHLESLHILNDSTFWSQRLEEMTSHEGLGTARGYIQHSGSTLTEVCLRHCFFTLRDLDNLLDLLESVGRGLTSLTVAVLILSPQVLDVLAEKLPHLRKLKIAFGDLKREDTPTDDSRIKEFKDKNIEAFLVEMKKRSYPEWRLRTFGVDHVNMTPESVVKIMTALSLCIPHLVEMHYPIELKVWELASWLQSVAGGYPSAQQ